MSLNEIVFVAAKRTPFAKFGSSFVNETATSLAVSSTEAALAQSGIPVEKMGHSVFGNVIQSSSDAAYLARHVALRVGAKQSIGAVTVNRLCGSGFEAVVQGAFQLLHSDAEAVIVGGAENMSQVPYVARGARFGYRMGNGTLEDSLEAGLSDAYVNLPMAITAENLAEQYKISREEVDEFALESQTRAAAAWEKGIFSDEVSAVTIKGRKGEVKIEKDEHFRADSTIEGLQKLRPVFKKDGVVTAGNASGMVDGACTLIATTREKAQEWGCEVLGTLRAWGVSGCDPKIMGIGPVPATAIALKNFQALNDRSISLKDFARVEINEAFSAQYLAVEKEMGLDRKITNVNGGSIAIGHPLAATGARLTGHMLYELKRAGGGLGLVSACIGGGQGMSLILEVS